MTEPFRTAEGGRVDRAKPIKFMFDGKHLAGLAGDTLASALLANGVHLAGRSFKYHRPRGIMTAGCDEPNALMRVGADLSHHTPNTRATEIELYEGLQATSQNRWPSLRFDLLAVNDALSRFIPAGFYYKTFMWPAWKVFEPSIRRMAGLGRAPQLLAVFRRILKGVWHNYAPNRGTLKMGFLSSIILLSSGFSIFRAGTTA